MHGTGTEELQSGPGVYSDTSFPGITSTTAIAGHRTTYLAPFRDINLLRSAGNRILLNVPYAHFTYTVIGQRVVSPSDVSAAVSRVGYLASGALGLHTAVQRRQTAVVYARLTRTVPIGAARVLPGHPLRIQPILTPAGHPAARRDALPAVLKPTQLQIPPATS